MCIAVAIREKEPPPPLSLLKKSRKWLKLAFQSLQSKNKLPLGQTLRPRPHHGLRLPAFAIRSFQEYIIPQQILKPKQNFLAMPLMCYAHASIICIYKCNSNFVQVWCGGGGFCWWKISQKEAIINRHASFYDLRWCQVNKQKIHCYSASSFALYRFGYMLDKILPHHTGQCFHLKHNHACYCQTVTICYIYIYICMYIYMYIYIVEFPKQHGTVQKQCA